MKTEDLIRALATDGVRPATPLSRHLLKGLISGVVVAVALFVTTLHPRPDLAAALRSPGFVYKIFVALALAASAVALLPKMARPLPVSRTARRVLIIAPALLMAGVIVELCTQPVALWMPRLVGRNAVHCLSLIPLLAAAPVACLLLALRRGAPAQPTWAGATVGLVAGGLGAALYALTCPDDSPLFVATWYTIAIFAVTGLAAYAGRRVLRW